MNDCTNLTESSTLETVAQTTGLGLTVTNTLTWNKHIEEISLKANRKLGLIRRLCKDNSDVETRKLLYSSIVRPQLVYASEVWSPYTIKHKLLIENVQRRTTKFILGYPQNMSYKQILIHLSILPLEYRREMADHVLLFKSHIGCTGFDHSKYIQKVPENRYYILETSILIIIELTL